MTRRKLAALKREVSACRNTQVKAKTLISLARRLGRKKENRGKEPTYVSLKFPDLPPLAIPAHGGKDLRLGTMRSIVSSLEDDIARWKEELRDDEQDEANCR
jgi:predicted RNA binding protein YcfA (HicA-like mRNA interferase family)